MNEQNRIAVMTLLDAVYENIQNTNDPDERMREYSVYVGWLEGALLAFTPDSRVTDLMSCIKVKREVDGIVDPDPTTPDGSFY